MRAELFMRRNLITWTWSFGSFSSVFVTIKYAELKVWRGRKKQKELGRNARMHWHGRAPSNEGTSGVLSPTPSPSLPPLLPCFSGGDVCGGAKERGQRAPRRPEHSFNPPLLCSPNLLQKDEVKPRPALANCWPLLLFTSFLLSFIAVFLPLFFLCHAFPFFLITSVLPNTARPAIKYADATKRVAFAGDVLFLERQAFVA